MKVLRVLPFAHCFPFMSRYRSEATQSCNFSFRVVITLRPSPQRCSFARFVFAKRSSTNLPTNAILSPPGRQVRQVLTNIDNGIQPFRQGLSEVEVPPELEEQPDNLAISQHA